MDMSQAVSAFSALAQPTRLEALRLLVQAGEEGMLSGEIGEALAIRQNTMSTNLGILTAAGLLRCERQGRAVRYFADFEGLQSLLGFLMEDCCGGQAELCRPLIEEIACAQESRSGGERT